MPRLSDMRSTPVLGVALALSVAAASPAPASAQLSVGLDLYWEFGDGDWRPYQPGVAIDVRYRSGDRYRDRYDRRYDDRYAHRPRAAPRVPPGHRPGPGMCRLWHPGVPPGHQPPPLRCDRVWGYYGPAYVLVGPRVRPPERYWVPRSSYAPRSGRPSFRLEFRYRGGGGVYDPRYDRYDGHDRRDDRLDRGYDRYERVRPEGAGPPRFKERAGPSGRAGPPPGRGRGKGRGKGPPGRGR